QAGKPTAAPRIAFVFSGQGTQWAGMGKALAAYPVAQAALDRVDAALRRHVAWSLRDALERSALADTEVAQPAIFAIQVALAALLASWGIAPTTVLGHSVGEIAAAHVAGILTLDDAVRVVVHRARLMQRATGHGAMAAVGLGEAATRDAIAGEPEVSISAINSATDTVIGGAPDAVARVVARLEAAGTSTRALGVAYAFHTAQMDPFVPELVDEVRGIAPAASKITMISTVTGDVIAPRFLHAEYWGRNLRAPVAFHAAAHKLDHDGTHDVVLELGPHPAVTRYLTGACETLRRDEPAGVTLGRALATAYVHGADLAWPAARPPADVGLPAYPWQHERLWPAGRAASPASARDSHPLLGAHVQLADDDVHAWQLAPDPARLAYLHDHVVSGAAVMPAAGYFDLLLSAAAQLVRQPALEDVELHEMLALDDKAAPSFQVVARGKAIELYTRDAGAAAWTRRASARLAGDAGHAPPRSPIADIRQRCFEPVAIAHLYNDLAEHGLDYGPAFRGLGDAWRRAGEAIGRLALPDELAGDAAAYAVHPALLDACLHVIAAALPPAKTERERASVLIPIAAGRIRWFRRPPAVVWSHVTQHPRTPGDTQSERADVRLLDDAGDTIAEITGLVLRRIALARPAAERAANDAMWRYAVEWRAVGAPPRSAEPAAGDHWVILADHGGVGEQVARTLERTGATCLVVERTGARRSLGAVEVDPSAPDAMHALIRARLGQARCRGVLHLWSLDAPADGALDAMALAHAQLLGVCSTLDLVQALATEGPAEPPRLWLFTRGAVHVADVGGGVAQAPLWGLGKAIAFEQPELACTMIDLDPRDATEPLADQVLDAIARPDSENQLALRGGARHVPRLVPTRLAACPRSGVASDELPADATYVITGGLGALGLLFAAWLVSRGARAIVLLGRRAPAPIVASRITDLRQHARVIVEQVDVADPDALAATLARVRASLPPVRGVIHAAAVLDDGALLEMSRERLATVLAPKVLGAWNLHTLTAGDPIDLFVMFSSAVSVLGSPGQANYTAANTFLDALAHHRRAAGQPALTVNWGPWAEIGLAAETVREAEGAARAHLVKMIEPGDGLDAFDQALRAGLPQVTILPFDVRNVLQFYPEGAGVSLFSEVLREDLQALTTSSGGDKRLYARPDIAQAYVAPRDDIEQVIAGIWQRALTIDRVGVHDNFFELGGDSVFAGQIVSRINKAFGVKIGLSDAFTSVTVAHLGQLVHQQLMAKVEELSDEAVELALQQQGG
ncbi:MAG TPA: SDR family NAD(P)-dependent oxidoreductase, partial [Kofleriaceae bacterium]|nr:SDR family NAD(P)-dependent oxidoreductase [Kofleriaceae bacterium]